LIQFCQKDWNLSFQKEDCNLFQRPLLSPAW